MLIELLLNKCYNCYCLGNELCLAHETKFYQLVGKRSGRASAREGMITFNC